MSGRMIILATIAFFAGVAFVILPPIAAIGWLLALVLAFDRALRADRIAKAAP